MKSYTSVAALLSFGMTVSATPTPLLAYVVGTAGNVVQAAVNDLGNTSALLMSSCSTDYSKCTVTASGGIENILTDGKSFVGESSVSAWMQNGDAYGSASLAGVAPLPFDLTCNTTSSVCTGTVTGSVTQVLTNGKEVEAWGWLTPSGYCSGGSCVGSITLLGDPGYKSKARRSIARAFGFSDPEARSAEADELN